MLWREKVFFKVYWPTLMSPAPSCSVSSTPRLLCFAQMALARRKLLLKLGNVFILKLTKTEGAELCSPQTLAGNSDICGIFQKEMLENQIIQVPGRLPHWVRVYQDRFDLWCTLQTLAELTFLIKMSEISCVICTRLQWGLCSLLRSPCSDLSTAFICIVEKSFHLRGCSW